MSKVMKLGIFSQATAPCRPSMIVLALWATGCSALFSLDESGELVGDAGVETDAAPDAALPLPLVGDCEPFLTIDGFVMHDSQAFDNGSLSGVPSLVAESNGKCGSAVSLADGYIEISEHPDYGGELSVDFWLFLESGDLNDSDGVNIFSFDSRGTNEGDLVIMLEERNNGGDTPRVIVRLQDGKELGAPGDGYHLCGTGLELGAWNRITAQVGASAPLQLWVNGQPASDTGPIDIFGLPSLECGATNGHARTASFASNTANFVSGSYLATTSGNPDFSLRQGAIDELYVWPALIVE